jgi:Tfp pilus assembly protein PilW
MITTTLSPVLRARALRSGPGTTGFTLVEVMIGASLSAFILAGVLSAFLFLARSGANLQNYASMESEARKSLEQFAQDTRQASGITWNSSTSVTLIVDSANITYAYTSSIGRFTRVTAAPSVTTTLLTGITSFTYSAYDINGTAVSLASLADAGKITKQLQISLKAIRTSSTVVGATNTVLSARYILRNKRITI